MHKSTVTAISVAAVAAVAIGTWAFTRWSEARVLDEGTVAVKNGEYARAVELLTPLSDAGNSVAQDTLGILYAYGWGVKRDRDRAVRLFASAGVSKLPDRFFSVGKELEEGKAVSKDETEALAWYKLAADAGHPQAKARLAAVGGGSRN